MYASTEVARSLRRENLQEENRSLTRDRLNCGFSRMLLYLRQIALESQAASKVAKIQRERFLEYISMDITVHPHVPLSSGSIHGAETLFSVLWNIHVIHTGLDARPRFKYYSVRSRQDYCMYVLFAWEDISFSRLLLCLAYPLILMMDSWSLTFSF